MSAPVMTAREAVARALYERRGLDQKCTPECVDHFEHDSSPEARACRDDGAVAYAALKAAGYGLWRKLDESEEDLW